MQFLGVCRGLWWFVVVSSDSWWFVVVDWGFVMDRDVFVEALWKAFRVL